MLSAYDLKEYRLLSNLSLRDVARYCNVSAQCIGQVETKTIGLTESTYQEIINGINRAKQAKADGTFAGDKAKELEETKAKQAEKAAVKKTASRKGSTVKKNEQKKL